jgi:L-iditol 2-dehydrogenase
LKAVVKKAPGFGNVELMDIPEPTPGPNQVKIEVKAAGICGTDIHILRDEYRSVPPVALGHEVCGQVAEVGENVTKVHPGDRVTTETYFSTCGNCRFCRSGNPNLCPERRSIGTHVHGGFAKYVLVPEKNVHKLPDNVDYIAGALCEPLTCCVHGVLENTRILPEDVVLVSGPGAMGLLSMQLAKSAGATVIICGTSQDAARLKLAKKLGANVTVDVQNENLKEIVQDLTKGYGADVVIECAGAEKSAQQCLDLVRRSGQYTQLGLFARPITLDLNMLAMKGVYMIGVFAHIPKAWFRTIVLLEQGRVKTRPLVTCQLPLEEWQQAFDKVSAGTECKVVLCP